MKWRVVGFKHPKDDNSRIYRKCNTDKEMLRVIERGIVLGCNLFSIRGIEE